jgi:hypothetical protein
MPWNVEPQKMLCVVTGMVALYGAILSTLNFLREQQKDKINLEITARDAFIDQPVVVSVKLVQVVNNSSFEIDVTSVGFVLPSREMLVFMPDTDHWYKIPDSIALKKSSSYSIRIERIRTLLNSLNINTKIRLKPSVMVNSKCFSGKPFLFDPEATT